MTRAEIKIVDGKKDLVNLYIHSDGYPSGIMKDIAEKYSCYKEVDGIPASEFNIYNGIGDFAVQLITHLKNDNIEGSKKVQKDLETFGLPKVEINHEPGWLYIVPNKTDRKDIEYYYELSSKNEKLYVECFDTKKKLFEGSLEEYFKWAEELESKEE